MSDTKKNWITVSDSKYPWERDALDFVRDRWPDHEPYRAWANFELIALDGSINEVDLTDEVQTQLDPASCHSSRKRERRS